MGKSGKRPKGDQFKQADIEAMYVLTKNWKSELLLYSDELKFFRYLIDKHVGGMVLKENLDTVRELELDLLRAGSEYKYLLRKKTNM